jgi:hypothetical protein
VALRLLLPILLEAPIWIPCLHSNNPANARDVTISGSLVLFYAENIPRLRGDRPNYHRVNFVRYLHPREATVTGKVRPELAERNQGEMEAMDC